MRRIGDLMKELGFNKDGSEESKKAFINHLVKAAQISQIDRKTKTLTPEPEQLSFQFDEDSDPGPQPTQKNPKVAG